MDGRKDFDSGGLALPCAAGYGMLSYLRSEKVDHPLANAKDAKRIGEKFPRKDPQNCVEDASYGVTSVNEIPALRRDKRYEVLSLPETATRNR